MKTKQIVILISGVLCLAAAVGMYIIGDNSSHLSELKDFFWLPIPLAIFLILLAMKKAKD